MMRPPMGLPLPMPRGGPMDGPYRFPPQGPVMLPGAPPGMARPPMQIALGPRGPVPGGPMVLGRMPGPPPPGGEANATAHLHCSGMLRHAGLRSRGRSPGGPAHLGPSSPGSGRGSTRPPLFWLVFPVA